jgi:2-polyprenyl-6-methoxyphenol hydroxylase-like FAD-dependent oxidoreductase
MNVGAHALVIGGSMAGLWAARVLADHFDTVTVVERDRLPTAPHSRAGVPQDKHVHVLLARGMLLAQEYFPGIADELAAAGAVRVNLALDSRTKMRGQWLQRFPSPYETYACSRVLFEHIIRGRVQRLPNVRFCEATQVTGLISDSARITGIQVTPKGENEAQPLLADFVVDAGGRTSQTPIWLSALGFGAPEETVIDAQVGYAGRRYRKPADFAEDWRIMLVGAEPPHKSRQGVIYEEEGGVWMVMLAGMLGDYPPTQDEAAFLAFAHDLEPDFHAAIAQAEPLSPIIGYRRTENRHRHYDRLDPWPERFVVLGDAAYAFNPIYGQGMTVAALSADALGRLLAEARELDGVAARFQRRLPQIVEPALLLATGADLEWVGKPANQPWTAKLQQWYLSRLLDAMPGDRVVHQAFSAVQHLLKPPTALARPGVAARVLGQWWKAKR